MKLALVVYAILALASADWTPKTPQEIQEDRVACYIEAKLSEGAIEVFKKGQIPDEPGCYFRCMGLKAGVWDDTSGFNYERIKPTLTAAGYETPAEGFTKCSNTDMKSEDTCIWSANVVKCLSENRYVKRRT